MMEFMTAASAGLMAQVIPALLVAGLLGPLLLGFEVQWPERFLYATQVIFVVAAEAACLYYAVYEQAVPELVVSLIQLAVMYLLLGIVSSVIVWARKSPREKADLAASKRAAFEARKGRH